MKGLTVTKQAKAAAATLGTLALVGGLVFGAAAPASAWGSGTWDAGLCSLIDADNTYSGQSYTDGAEQIVYVSMAAPGTCVFTTSPTGYVQTRKNPNGVTSPTNCSQFGCEYVLQTTYGAKSYYWGGVHYFNNQSHTT